MSERFTSAPSRALQVFSLVALALAAATNYSQFAADLIGLPWMLATGSVAVIEAGLLAGAWHLVPSLKARSWGAAGLSAAIVIVCGANALNGGMGAAWERYSAKADVRSASVHLYQDASTRVNELQDELISLSAIRQTTAISEDLNKCRRCQAAPRWRTELAQAEKRDGLASSLAIAKTERDALKPASRQASPFATFAAQFGISEDHAELYAAIMYVLLLQMTAPMAAMLAGSINKFNTKPNSKINTQAKNDDIPMDYAIDANAKAQLESASESENESETQLERKEKKQSVQKENYRANQVLDIVTAAGGTLRTTSKALAKQMGASEPTVRLALKDAKSAGFLSVSSGRRIGTILSVL